MESPENIAGGYSASGGWGSGPSNNNDRSGDDRTVDQLRQAQEINLLNTNAYLNDIDLSNRRGIDQVMNLFTSQYGPISRSAFNTAYDRTLANPGGIGTLGYNTAKTLNRIAPSLFSGQVKTNVPQLSGTVFSKKAPGGGTLVMSGGKSMGMSAEDYYSGKSGADVGRSDLETYQDKYGYATPQERELNRAYDQYMNPYNERGKVGYNPDAPTMNPVTDQVRPGLRSGIFTDMSGRPTVQGPLRTMDTAYSAQDRTAMSLAGLTLGGLMQQLTGKKTVIGNVPSMDAMLPTPEMVEQGQTYGGLSRQIGAGIGDVVQGVQSYFSPEPQNRPPAPQYTEAQLSENMYGVGMPDLGVSSYGAPVPEANIQLNRSAGPITTEDVVRDIDTVLDKLNTGALGEIGKQSNRGTLRPEDINAQDLRTTAGAALADANFDGTYDRSFFNDVLGIMGLTETPTFDFQPQILQRTPSGEFIEIQPRERKEIQGPQSSRSLPNVMTLADAGRNTYRSGYQGQSGLYNPGGKGQTYYGGGDQQNKNFLGTAAERARQAFDNLYGYFTG